MLYENKDVSSTALNKPKSLEITPTAVYVRKEIEEFTEESEGEERRGWRYKESKYSKDEYIEKLTKRDDELSVVTEETRAALYELMTYVLEG